MPPFSAGPYGHAAAPISPQPPAAPVHQPAAGSQEENVWKDFPPLQLPPVHLPIAAHPIRQSSGEQHQQQQQQHQQQQQQQQQQDSKQNGHTQAGQGPIPQKTFLPERNCLKAGTG